MRCPLLSVLAVLMLSGTSFAMTKKTLSYSELQRILAERQDSTWQAAPNDLAKKMGIYDRQDPFGVLQSEEKVELQRSDMEVLREDATPLAPTTLDWRNKDGQNWLSPIRDPGQGLCNACVSFVSVAVLETALKIAAKNPALSIDLSEQFLFGNIGRCSRGTSIYSGASSLKEKGVPDESCMPYASGSSGLDISNSLACKDFANRSYKVLESKSMIGLKAVKAALLSGPVLSRMTIYEDFLYYKSGVYKHVAGAELGAHAVVIVGYDDEEQAFIARNSWGTAWGEQGYFRIKYGESKLASMGISFTATAPKVYADLVQPKNGDVLDGTQEVIGNEIYNAELSSIDFEVINKKQADIRSRGSLDLSSRSQLLDTTQLPDGEYEIAVRATGISGGTLPVYSTFYVANTPQKVAIELILPTQSEAFVSGDVQLNAIIQTGAVPLSLAELHFVKKDGTFQKLVKVVRPGSKFQIKWGTKDYPNGDYDIWIKGLIGTKQAFLSNVLQAVVKND